ncbi:hypothetical protein Tco_0694738 [Tanacetum coccineum]
MSTFLSTRYRRCDATMGYLNFWVPNGGHFRVSHIKSTIPNGFWMFRLVKKLKQLKKPLRKLLYDYGNIHDNVIRLRTELDRVQTDLDLDPFNNELREEEVRMFKRITKRFCCKSVSLNNKRRFNGLKKVILIQRSSISGQRKDE